MRAWPKLAAVLVGVAVASSCATDIDRIDPWRLVPEGSIAAVRLSWDLVSADPALRRITGMETLEGSFRDLGVPVEGIEGVIVFADGIAEGEGRAAALVTGDIAAEDLPARLEASGWRAIGVRNMTVYRSPTTAECVAVLDTRVIAFGTCPGVEAVGAVLEGSLGTLLDTPDAAELAAAVDAEGAPVTGVFLVRGAAALAGRVLFEGAGLLLDWGLPGALGAVLRMQGTVEGCGAAVGRDTGGIALRLHVLFSDDGTADTVAGLLDAARVVGETVANPPPGFSVEPRERRVRIAMTVDENHLGHR